MLARLTLTMGPRSVVALLGEDLTWQSEDLLTQSYLNSCYGPPKTPTIEVGPRGYQQATRAAKAVQDAGWNVTLQIASLNQSAA
jgi:hypothetical protein